MLKEIPDTQWTPNRFVVMNLKSPFLNPSIWMQIIVIKIVIQNVGENLMFIVVPNWLNKFAMKDLKCLALRSNIHNLYYWMVELEPKCRYAVPHRSSKGELHNYIIFFRHGLQHKIKVKKNSHFGTPFLHKSLLK